MGWDVAHLCIESDDGARRSEGNWLFCCLLSAAKGWERNMERGFECTRRVLRPRIELV